MIITTLTEFIIICLGAVLAVLALLWLWLNVSNLLSEKKRNRWRRVCPVCGEVFHEKSSATECTCPGCGRMVEHRTVLDI